MGKKYTYEDIKFTIESLGFVLLSKEYKGYKDKLIIKDNEGYFYFNYFINLISKNHKSIKFHKNNPYTIQNIKLWCKLNNKNFEILSGIYERNNIKLKWKCLKEGCGEIFEATWNDIYGGRGCGYCNGKQVGLSNCLATKNPEFAKEWHPTLNGDLTPWDVTEHSNKDVWWLCKDNLKHEWHLKINARINGNTNCPYCSGRYPTEENNLLVINPKLCEEWDYKKNKKSPEEYTPSSGQYVWWKCLECGHEWKAIISNRSLLNSGCPKCNESKGEKQLDIILSKYNIPHDSQYTFDDLKGVGDGLLRFDVPIFWDKEKTQLRMLIEYDGIFHFEKQYENDGHESIVIHDKLKDEYCKIHNINLLRIPYWDFDNIESILEKELEVM